MKLDKATDYLRRLTTPARVVVPGQEQLRIRHLDLECFDRRLARDVVKGFAQLQARYPEVDTVKWVSVQSRGPQYLRGHVGARAISFQTFTGQSGIIFSDSWARDYRVAKRDLESDAKKGWIPAGTGVAAKPVIHEFGHHVQWYLEKNNVASEVLQLAGDLANKDDVWLHDNLSGVAANPGGHSVRSGEIIAEAFSEYLLSASPRPAARELGEAIDRAFAQIRGTAPALN